MRYYISDCHFFHTGLLKRMDKRNFVTIEKMNNYMVTQINSRVRRNDDLIILGDFSLGKGEETNEILKQLKCKNIGLVIGNHDKFLKDKKFDRSLFKWIEPYKELNDNGRKVILSHYPICEYNQMFRRDENGNPKTYMLFGHIHLTSSNVYIEHYKDFVRNYQRPVRDSDTPVAAPIQMINCFCMLSDYVPLTLDEWIEIEKSGAIKEKIDYDWKYDGGENNSNLYTKKD